LKLNLRKSEPLYLLWKEYIERRKVGPHGRLFNPKR